MFRFVKPIRFAALACLTLAATGAGGAVSLAQQRQTPLFYDSRRLPDMEVERRNQEVLQEQRRAAEERRLEAEASARRAADDAKVQDARLAAEAAAKKKADEARVAAAEAETAAKKKADEAAKAAALEAQRKADEDKRLAAEADAKKKADEAARVAALEAQRKADEDKRLAAEADAKKKADEAARVAALEAQRKADEDKRLAAEADAKKKADEAARVAALEAQRKADEDKRLAAEADAKKKADEAARVAALAAQRKADEEKRLAAEADAKKKADEAARVAALSAQQVRSAAAQQTAALIPKQPGQPAAIEPVPGAPCEATKARISYLPGGVMRAVIASPCRKGQSVTTSYGGYESVHKIDGNGNATADIDLFLGNTEQVTLAYAGGHSEAIQPAARDLNEVSKVALIWQAPVNLDLHALENGALVGKAGDVWPGSGTTLDTAKAQISESGRGAGYLSTQDTGNHESVKVEVYTFVHSPEQDSGAVAMVLDYVSRGDRPSGELCGDGALASIPFEVVSINRLGNVRREGGLIPAARCGEVLNASTRYIRGAVPDLRFRR